MSTRLLLNGNDLETLLAQVRDEYGPSARIISADRVRSGGIAGFFAREHFELTVEVEEAAPPAERIPGAERIPAAAVSQMATLEDLLNQADTADVVSTQSRPASSVPVPPRVLQAAARKPRPPLPAAKPTKPTTPTRPPQTAPATQAIQAIQAIQAVKPVKPVQAVKPIAAEPPALLYTSTLARYPRLAGTSLEAPQEATPQRARPPLVRPIRSDTITKPFPVASYQSAPALVGLPQSQHPSAPQNPEETAARVTPHPTSGENGIRSRLTRLGVPGWLADRASGPDSYAAITGTFSDLPAAPEAPSGRGEILLLIGDLAGAAEAARAALATLRLDASALAACGPNAAALPGAARIAGPAEAGRWAAQLRTGDSAGVIIVETDLGNRGAEWARAVSLAVTPTTVWAVVDATRKTSDCSRWLKQLGQVDSVAVHSTTGTGDPASVLALGLPVAMVDGQPATPHTWAALLCRRLTDSANADR